MHHARLTINGVAQDCDRCARELEELGAVRVDGVLPLELVWSTSARPDVAVKDASTRHPAVILSVEQFEALGDERVCSIVSAGRVTVIERCRMDEMRPYVVDDDGDPLDLKLLHRCAERVAAQPRTFTVTTPLASVLALGRALGRLCACADEPTQPDAPSSAAIASLLELASLALTIGATTASMQPAQRVFARSLMLSTEHARTARTRVWTESWSDWVALVIWSASGAIDAGWHCTIDVEPMSRAVHAEHLDSSEEQLTSAATSLLATCLETLVLFGSEEHEHATG